MSDRSLINDMREHARRLNPQADDSLAEIRDQIRLACSRDAGFTHASLDDLEPHDYTTAADLIIGGIVQPLLARMDELTAQLADLPAPETEYGLRLRDGTILTADNHQQREARAAEFEAAQWEITRLRREKHPAQAHAWEETHDA